MNLPSNQLIELTDCQSEVHDSAARFRVLVAGRRFGKTHLALVEMLKVALQPNRVLWYVGPNDGQSKRIAWERLKQLTRPYWAKNPKETELRIEFATGSSVTVIGAFKPDSLRGVGLDFIVLDECACMEPAAWPEALRPALADREGRALFIGTPKGRNHFYDLFQYAKEARDWQAFQFSTEQGGLVTLAELQSAAHQLDPDSYRQEFHGEFVSAGHHRVYYTFEPAIHLQPVDFVPNLPLIWAIDFNVDPMSMLVMQRDKDTVNVFDEIVLSDANTQSACQAFIDRVEPLTKRLPHHCFPLQVHVYADASGSQRRTSAVDTDWQIIRQCVSHWKGVIQLVLHQTKSNPLVRDRVNCVNSRLRNQSSEAHLFINPRCRHLIKDFDQVAWATDSSGTPTSEIDKSDRLRTHTSDALGYYIVQAFPLLNLVGPQSTGRII